MGERGDVGAIRRAQIVEAASRVIARKGFHNATLAEVEAEAGISRGMMTYHFPTKDTMIAAVFKTTMDRLRQRSAGPIGASSAAERIDLTIDAALADGSANEEFLGLYHTFLALATHREDYRAALAAIDGATRDRLARDLIELGNDPDTAKEVADSLLATLRGLATLRLVNPDGFDPARLARTLKRFARSWGATHPEADQMV